MQKNKLKKKWKFWRAFKQFILRKKKVLLFFKLKWMYNNQKIIMQGLKTFYGKNLKKNIKVTKKKVFKNNFFNFLSILELRLNVILSRLGWIKNIKNAKAFLLFRVIAINGVIVTSSNYVLEIGDILKKRESVIITKQKSNFLQKRFIRVIIKNNFITDTVEPFCNTQYKVSLSYGHNFRPKRKFKLQWKRYNWYKWYGWQFRIKNWVITPWFLSKICIYINFLEKHISQGLIIIIARPLIGELLIHKSKDFFKKNSNLLKKIYSI